MRRQLKILAQALSSLRRHPGKNLALVVVYAFTITVLASVLFLTHALRTEAQLLLAAAPDLIVQQQVAGRHELIAEEHAALIRALPGVATVEPRHWGYYYDALTGANYTLIGLSAAAAEPGPLLQGRWPQRDDECALGAGVAAVRQVDAGDVLVFIDAANRGRPLEVSGVFMADSQLLSNDLVVLTSAGLRSFFAFPDGRATDLAVRVHNPREIDTLARKVKRELPATRPITRGEMLRTYEAVFNWRGGMLLSVCAAALVAFCILAWDKATGLSAEERREIGILKAIGWDTADILWLKFWEGLAMALTAFLLGLLAALLHVFWFDAPLLSAVVRGWSVLFPRFALTPHLDLYQIAVLAMLTIAPYLACTLTPAWKAAVSDPDAIMRL